VIESRYPTSGLPSPAADRQFIIRHVTGTSTRIIEFGRSPFGASLGRNAPIESSAGKGIPIERQLGADIRHFMSSSPIIKKCSA
jgi:hypothetical protein